jgi:archaellum biogenesis ATPase FlaH
MNNPQINIRDKIKSLRETVGVEYKRPDPSKIETLMDCLWGCSKALEYLHLERGLTDDTIKHFNLGYDYDKNAIAIPIYKKIEGKDVLINIKYRFLEPDKIKYTSEKGAETWIYNEEGIHRGVEKKSILIVEGEFDLMSAWQSGIKSVVSPASGKDSYGVWVEMLDNIQTVYIAYDNDKAGQSTSVKLADRLGTDKCFEIKYPEGIKDANEFFKKNTREQFKDLIKTAKPYYTYQYKGLGEIINSLRFNSSETIKTKFIPNVDIEKDWLIVVSGRTNAGKTSYTMNMADEFSKQNIPTLIFPFERGIESVGKRFLQVKFDKTINDFQMMSEEEWKPIVEESIDVPIYFSTPKKEDIVETIIKAKRLFNTRIVIIDHLDYIVRHVAGNREAEISNTLQDLKRVAEENGIIMIVVSHIRKIDQAGAELQRKAGIEDLKGSASLYQDPECVVLLDGDGETEMEVRVVKNKGPMGSKMFRFTPNTGRLTDNHDFESF